jgi:hypothetical protein
MNDFDFIGLTAHRERDLQENCINSQDIIVSDLTDWILELIAYSKSSFYRRFTPTFWRGNPFKTHHSNLIHSPNSQDYD